MTGWIRTVLVLASLVISIMSITGCTTQVDDGTRGMIVTVGPQKEMVEAVGGDMVHVIVMVPPGKSPHTYTPVPSQMKEVAKATAYFKVGSGVEFELVHLDDLKEQNKEMRVFDCSNGIDLIGTGDPHIWLNPQNVRTMVENILSGLVEVDPVNEATYRSNRDAYLARLDTLHTEIEEKLGPHQGERFLTYHSGWGYLALEYALEQVAVESLGKEPGPAGIARVVEQAMEIGVDVIFIDPSFDRTKAEAIAFELGGSVITLDPLAEDYLDNMKRSVDRLEEGLA